MSVNASSTNGRGGEPAEQTQRRPPRGRAYATLALRLLWRGAGGRSAGMLALSLIVAVAVVATLTLTTDRLQRLIYSKASHFLAADARISGSLAIPDQWLALARDEGLQAAPMMTFRAMLFGSAGENGPLMQLGAVKAVADNYPLKGELLTALKPFGVGQASELGPKPGEVWLTSRLFGALAVAVGDTLSIGDAEFVVARALIQEPDSPQSVLGFAPRALMNRQDVERTGAIALGSRVNYSLTLAGEAGALERVRQAIEPELGSHFKWRAAGEGDGPDAGVFQRITHYVMLVGALALVLGAVAIALAADEFARSQHRNVALLKTLGLGPKAVLQVFSWQLLALAVIGAAVGLLMGWLFQLGLLQFIAALVPESLPAPHWSAFAIPVVGGVVVLLLFAGPRFWQLHQVLPVAVLRAQLQQGSNKHWWLGLLAIFALVALLTRHLVLTALAAAVLVIAFFAVKLLVMASFNALQRIHGRLRGAWRLGLGQWLNYRSQNATQATVFSLIFIVLFSVYSARTHLLSAWQQQVPDGAPNHFVFNIYDHQKDAVAAFIDAEAQNASLFYAMTRGRVTQVNDVPWQEQLSDSPNEQSNDYERELNLTWASELQDDNEIVEGAWWESASDDSPLLISIEKDYAEGANISVGDRVVMSLAGQVVEAEVANIRTLNWQSMRPNFFIIFNRKPLPFVASNWITSFYLSPDKKQTVNALVQQFPSITLIEIDQTLATVKGLINQLGRAVEYLLVLIILAALMVLATGMLVTLPLRLRTSALMRAFGANRRLIQRALWCEFLILGLIAGGVACIGTELLVRFWLASALELSNLGFLPVWFWGIPLAMAVLAVAGVLATRRATTVAPSQLLKSA
ncbi:MAG TPA: FtsX-like permease family protein [Marinagarivorans sp.]